MIGTSGLNVHRALDIINSGGAETLDGRGVNTSYKVSDDGQEFSVKIHCAFQSSILHRRKILRVDGLLSGAPWYPPLIDIGFHSTGRSRLVVIRPFASGTATVDVRIDVDRLVGVLGEMAALGDGLDVSAELVGDYASPWISCREQERGMLEWVMTEDYAQLFQTVDDHLDDLLSSAVRLTHPTDVAVYHGDLHGRNLIFDGPSRFAVIDWDEAGFSSRPADVAKALWLSCRKERNNFDLDLIALRHFLELMHARLGTSYSTVGEVAKLGAIWFLPRRDHIMSLGQRNSELVPWYLNWVSRFWSRFAQNLDLVNREAARL